jgi:MFS family permease
VAEASPSTEQLPASPRSMRAVVVDRAFPSLHHRNFRLFFFGQLVSLVGTWTQQVAQSWLVWTISHSPFMLGVFAGLQSLPVLVFGLYGGVMADRYPKRALLITTQLAAAALALVLAILTATGVVGPGRGYSLLIIGVLAFGLGTVNAFDAPARQAFVVDLVGKKHLLNAISLNSSIFNGARIVGPATAAILISTVGTAVCFFINAFSFVPVIIGLYLIRTQQKSRRVGTGSIRANLRDALGYSWREPVVRDLFITVVVVSLFVFSYISLLPAFADAVLHTGAAGLGILTTANGAGALVAAFSLAISGDARRSRGFRIVWSAILYCVLISAFALSNFLPLSVLLLAAAGWAGIAFLARANTALQSAVPDEMRGRVMSIYILILMGLAPIGAVQLGLLAHTVGAPRAVAIEAAVGALVLTLLHALRPHVRRDA